MKVTYCAQWGLLLSVVDEHRILRSNSIDHPIGQSEQRRWVWIIRAVRCILHIV
jgi:hypothetical protein